MGGIYTLNVLSSRDIGLGEMINRKAGSMC